VVLSGGHGCRGDRQSFREGATVSEFPEAPAKVSFGELDAIGRVRCLRLCLLLPGRSQAHSLTSARCGAILTCARVPADTLAAIPYRGDVRDAAAVNRHGGRA